MRIQGLILLLLSHGDPHFAFEIFSSNTQIGGLNMQDANSTDVKRRRVRRRREETPEVVTVGGELRVWRDQGTNEIVIEPPVFAPAKKRGLITPGGLITLSVRDARHLANSLLLFVEETESSPTFTAGGSSIRLAQDAERTQSP